jgi:hypothetical protein
MDLQQQLPDVVEIEPVEQIPLPTLDVHDQERWTPDRSR